MTTNKRTQKRFVSNRHFWSQWQNKSPQNLQKKVKFQTPYKWFFSVLRFVNYYLFSVVAAVISVWFQWETSVDSSLGTNWHLPCNSIWKNIFLVWLLRVVSGALCVFLVPVCISWFLKFEITIRYNITLLPSVSTLIARGMFRGAKNTHHTFTAIMKHLITTTANKHPSKKSFIDKNKRKSHWHVHIT